MIFYWFKCNICGIHYKCTKPDVVCQRKIDILINEEDWQKLERSTDILCICDKCWKSKNKKNKKCISCGTIKLTPAEKVMVEI